VDRGEERGHVDTRRCSRTMYTRVVLAATRLHRTFLNLKRKVLRLLKSFFLKFLVMYAYLHFLVCTSSTNLQINFSSFCL